MRMMPGWFSTILERHCGTGQIRPNWRDDERETRFVFHDPCVLSFLPTQIALNLLLWGEAANLRLCPEFLCWAYHKSAKRLRDDVIKKKVPKQFLR